MHDAVTIGTERARPPGRLPAGLVAGPAFGAVLSVCVLAGRASSPRRLVAEVAVLAVIVAVVGFESRAAAGFVTVGTSVLSVNGFGVHSLGELGWHPAVDLPVAAALLCAWALGWTARAGVLAYERPHRAAAAAATRNPREERHERPPLRRTVHRPVRVAGAGAARAGATVTARRSER